MSAVCRDGHLSDEPDYCSVCGAPVLAGSVSSPGAPPPPTSATSRGVGPQAGVGSASGAGSANCPSCGEPREDPDGRFCEVCRYDFTERRPGPPPVVRGGAPRPSPATPAPQAAPQAAPVVSTLTPSAPVAPVAPVAASPTPFAASPPPSVGWELVIAVDPKLDTEPDPSSPCPTGRADLVMPVDKPDMLVGRHDDTRAIHPEISLHDPGASRRHAKFVIDPDGAIALQDLASTNGTEVNAVAVPPGTRKRLVDGDSVTLGRWTRITVRSRA